MVSISQVAGLVLTLSLPLVCSAQFTAFTPPANPAQPVLENRHGFQLRDDFQWLENKDDAKVKAWTQAQHDASIDWLAKNAPSPKGLREDLSAIFDRDSLTAPTFYRGREYLYRKLRGEAQHKLYTRLNGQLKLLFDPTLLDPSGKSSIVGVANSRDGKLIAVSVQFSGNEITDAHFLDSMTGEAKYPPLKGASSVSFQRDSNSIYFTKRTAELIAAQKPLPVYSMPLGADPALAAVAVSYQDAKNWASKIDAEWGDVSIQNVGDFWSRNIAIIRPEDKAPLPIYTSSKHRVDVSVYGKQLLIWSNDDAPNGQILTATLDKPESKDWQVLIAERPDVVMVRAVKLENYLITQEKHRILHKLILRDLQGKPIRELQAPAFGDLSGLSVDPHDNSVTVTLNTALAPAQVYKINGNTLTWTLVFEEPAPLDMAEFETQLKFIKARDGKDIPLLISGKKGLLNNGQNPVLLNGYGGFNIGIKSRYMGSYTALMRQGFTIVEAGIRGGDEFGEAWHRDGMLTKKQNTFNDYYDTAEWLIAEKITNPSKLIAIGGSNGGLLMGAAATQRPDLFRAIVCQVPLLDMLRYEQFLIARFWIPEYGDPKVREDFIHIQAYSPYHQIKLGQGLPHMIVIAGENDSRVDPLHAKKFVALAQNNPAQQNPVLLKMDFAAGHGTGKSTAQQIEDREVWMRYALAMVKPRNGS